jgi:hypothetical protein
MQPADYLRVALTYMLISMPHGTSTIFGAFQAILALLANGRTGALVVKLPPDEKFASEIFGHETPASFVALQNRIAGSGRKLKVDQGVRCSLRLRPADRTQVTERKH